MLIFGQKYKFVSTFESPSTYLKLDHPYYHSKYSCNMGYRVSIIGRRGSDGSGLLSKQFFFFHLHQFNLSSTYLVFMGKKMPSTQFEDKIRIFDCWIFFSQSCIWCSFKAVWTSGTPGGILFLSIYSTTW